MRDINYFVVSDKGNRNVKLTYVNRNNNLKTNIIALQKEVVAAQARISNDCASATLMDSRYCSCQGKKAV